MWWYACDGDDGDDGGDGDGGGGGNGAGGRVAVVSHMSPGHGYGSGTERLDWIGLGWIGLHTI